MAATTYVGRVGGLAIALGVGAALAGLGPAQRSYESYEIRPRSFTSPPPMISR